MSRKPETLAQALEWERAKTRYLRLGLCHKCAALAAWGHQHGAGGWQPLHPPCSLCAPIVASFPVVTTNPAWRKVLRTPNTRPPAVPCPRATAAIATVI